MGVVHAESRRSRVALQVTQSADGADVRRWRAKPLRQVRLKRIQSTNTTMMMANQSRNTEIGRQEGLAADGAARASRRKPCHDSSSAKNSRGRIRMMTADW